MNPAAQAVNHLHFPTKQPDWRMLGRAFWTAVRVAGRLLGDIPIKNTYYVVQLQKITQFQIDTKDENDVNSQKKREIIMQDIRYF